MKSHEYAAKLKLTADYLLSRPEFETPRDPDIYLGNYWEKKEQFIAAVRALGSGKKKVDGSEFQFTASTPIPIWVRVQRSTVCRKVQEEKWECEPMFSPAEEAAMELEQCPHGKRLDDRLGCAQCASTVGEVRQSV